MAWENCNIILNCGSTGFFYAGDIVTGCLVLEFSDEQRVESIKFKVKGKSKAQWSRSKPTVPYIKIYSEKNKELEIAVDVFPELQGRKVTPGIYNHLFHFSLPDRVPPTFSSSIASVQYYIKVEGKSMYRLRKKKTIPLIVMKNLNLNNSDEFLNPVSTQIQKAIWNSGYFSVSIETYKGIYTNQNVPFSVFIQNEKKVKISKFQVTLVQKRKYIISSGYYDEEKAICKKEYDNFLSTVQEFCQFQLQIPQVIASSVDSSTPLIQISYLFRVAVHFPFHLNVTEDIPVTVASIPVVYNKSIHI